LQAISGVTTWSSAAVTAPGNYKFKGAAGCPTLQVVYTTYTSGSLSTTIAASASVGNPTVNQTNSAALSAGAWLNNSGTQVQATSDASANLNVNLSASSYGAATTTNQTLQLAQESTTATNTANIGSVSSLISNFSRVIASGVDTSAFTLLESGSGQTVSQAGGSLIMTAGTTANSETIVRSNSSFSGSFIFKELSSLSQRIANNNFYAEIVDDVGDGLAYTINSATSVTVTIPSNPFTSANVGQSMNLGVITGASTIPGRYAIASVSGNNVTFTVAGWPASGTGTLSLFGWNYYHVYYTGTTATNADFDAQNKGWNSGETVATINTTASPGHQAIISAEDSTATLMDQLAASGTTIPTTYRASRIANTPVGTTPLYIQFRVLNGTTAPASTTTWTIQQTSLEGINSNPVTIGNVKPQNQNNPLPVTVQNSPATTVSSGTITTVTTVTTDNLATNSNVADLTSTAKTATFVLAVAPASNAISYAGQINVTASSGTSQTMDCSLLESLDGGTTYPKTVYTFERITGVLSAPLVSPLLRYGGNKLEWSCVIGGTTPSFTMTLNRVGSGVAAGVHYNLFDRTLVPSTIGSSGITWYTEGCTTGQLTYYSSAATTNPTVLLQTSGDGTNWANTSITITPSGAGAFTTMFNNLGSKYSRIYDSAAGSGITYGYSEINCTGP